jgi:AcrR family transcriptional regulator
MSSRKAVLPHDTSKYESILRHAVVTFANQGFCGTDVQVIADLAGVGKGTVYRYFGSKEGLFWAATYCVLEQLGAHILAAVEGVQGAVDSLLAAGVAYAEFFEENPPYLEIFAQNRAEFRGSVPAKHKEFHEHLIGAFTDIVQRGVAVGELRPVDARRVIISLGSVFHGTVMFGCYVTEDFTLSELARHTLEIFLRGIRAR